MAQDCARHIVFAETPVAAFAAKFLRLCPRLRFYGFAAADGPLSGVGLLH